MRQMPKELLEMQSKSSCKGIVEERECEGEIGAVREGKIELEIKIRYSRNL